MCKLTCSTPNSSIALPRKSVPQMPCLSRPAQAWGSIQACPTFVGRRDFGTRTPPIASWVCRSSNWPTPPGITTIRSWRGASTVIDSICTGPPSRTPASNCCARGAMRRPLGILSSPATSMATSNGRVSTKRRIVERHGSLHFLQCRDFCSAEVLADGGNADRGRSRHISGCTAVAELPTLWRISPAKRVDVQRLRLDRGPHGGADGAVHHLASIAARSSRGGDRTRRRLLAVPTVRRETERVADVLIRIDFRRAASSTDAIPLAMPALVALTGIADRLA